MTLPFAKHLALVVTLAFYAITGGTLVYATCQTAETHFLEAEAFATLGGWDVDQQSLEQVGSSYLLAHGLGVPVDDAKTTLQVKHPGKFRVWVRTRDWVAPWKVKGAPGKFQLLVNGVALKTTFGTEGEPWHWQDGGEVQLGAENEIALHDLTGFNGRCDAIVFSNDPNFVPPNQLQELTTWRRKQLGLDGVPKDGGTFDLVVVGGGISGCATAISAARNGLSVALIQDRPVLGGNGSSEVRVWPEGHTRQKPYHHVGDIVEEMMIPRPVGVKSANAKKAEVYGDSTKMQVIKGEPNISLFTEQRVFAAETDGDRVVSVTAHHIRSSRHTTFSGTLFADCTGDGTVGFLSGADFEMTEKQHQGMSNLWNLLDASDPKEVLKCECKDKTALGVAAKAGKTEMKFPRCPWAIDLSDKPFPGRGDLAGQWGSKNPLENLGGWYWESGFDRHPIDDVERIRDLNLRAMFGAWDALKNVDGLYPNHRIAWAAFIAGKRESRRLMGDVVLSADDFRKNKVWKDGVFPCSWGIDVHHPHDEFDDGHEGDEFISYATHGEGYKYKGPYWAPYRCLYSRNRSNLFMAGRDISVTHEGLGPVRVMRTCGMMGEIVGKAAWLCVHHRTTPRGVYETYLDELKELLTKPGSMRRDAVDGQLKLPPGYDFSKMIQPAPASAKFVDDKFEIWGGSVVQGKDGLYHMYYSRWPRELSHWAWVTHSEIAHAVSESPTGPWKHRDVALPARGGDYWDGNCTHNPTVLRRGNRYYLYYMGNRGNGKVDKPLNWEHRNLQRIGVATAESPNGPWKRFDKPVIDVSADDKAPDSLCVSNPSVAFRPDGGVIMVYKCVGKERPLPFGGPVRHLTAIADNPVGPFKKTMKEAFSVPGENFAAEDPYIWRGVDRYWAIVKDNKGNFTNVGTSMALFESVDGFDWKLSRSPLVSTLQVNWEQTGLQELSALERPQIVLVDGKPVALCCAAATSKERVRTFNVQIPLREK